MHPVRWPGPSTFNAGQQLGGSKALSFFSKSPGDADSDGIAAAVHEVCQGPSMVVDWLRQPDNFAYAAYIMLVTIKWRGPFKELSQWQCVKYTSECHSLGPAHTVFVNRLLSISST